MTQTKLIPSTRAHFYSLAFPKRPRLATHGHGEGEWVTGAWLIGNCYRATNPIYGAYPPGYLVRVHSMFPDARKVLHVFSGGLTFDAAMKPLQEATRRYEVDSPELELVDAMGPAEGRSPTWQGDVCAMPAEWAGRFDLILADPPYSAADAVRYGYPMPQSRKVMRELRRVAQPGANLVWLATDWPMHRKDEWRTWAHIALVRSTNNRVRLVSMFEAV